MCRVPEGCIYVVREIVLREEGRLPGKRENTKVDEMLIYEIALMAFW